MGFRFLSGNSHMHTHISAELKLTWSDTWPLPLAHSCARLALQAGQYSTWPCLLAENNGTLYQQSTSHLQLNALLMPYYNQQPYHAPHLQIKPSCMKFTFISNVNSQVHNDTTLASCSKPPWQDGGLRARVTDGGRQPSPTIRAQFLQWQSE